MCHCIDTENLADSSVFKRLLIMSATSVLRIIQHFCCARKVDNSKEKPSPTRKCSLPYDHRTVISGARGPKGDIFKRNVSKLSDLG